MATILLRKAHIKQYEKTGKSGQRFTVKEHDDKRGSALDDVMPAKRPVSEKGQKGTPVTSAVNIQGFHVGGSAKPDLFSMSPEDRAAYFDQMAQEATKQKQRTYAKVKDLNALPGVEVHKADPKTPFVEPADWSKVGKANEDIEEPPFEAMNNPPPPEPKGKKKKGGLASIHDFLFGGLDPDEGDAKGSKGYTPMPKLASAGSIIVEPDGRLWVVEPKDHFGGYQHTYPKGRVEPGMSAQETAIKEAMEESGLEIEILGHLGDYDGSMTSTRYYVARRIGGNPKAFGEESHAVKLIPQEHLDKFMNVMRDQRVAQDFTAKYQQAMQAGNGDLKAGWATLPPWEAPPKPAKPEKSKGQSNQSKLPPWKETTGKAKDPEGKLPPWKPTQTWEGGKKKDITAESKATAAADTYAGLAAGKAPDKSKSGVTVTSRVRQHSSEPEKKPGLVESAKEKMLRLLMFKSHVKAHERHTAHGIVHVRAYETLVQKIKQTLSPDLLHPKYRNAPASSPDPACAGHCYAATEALYHLGAKDDGYHPHTLRHEGSVHWFLRHESGDIIDPTASQFQTEPHYPGAVRRGFLTKKPSKRAQKIMDRVQAGPDASHREIVESVGGRYEGNQTYSGKTYVTYTEPKTGSTTATVLSATDPHLTYAKVATKLAEVRERFGLKKGLLLLKGARSLHQRLMVFGLPISIENRVGSIRSWYDPMKDEQGHTRMRNRYGYIRGTVGHDDDHLDCFLGPDIILPADGAMPAGVPDEPARPSTVYVIDQVNPETGEFDEHKCMLGFPSATEAKAAYLQHYDDPRFYGGMEEVPVGEFRHRVGR